MSGDPEKRVLITGGSGFAGSHLAALLSSQGFEVFLFDLSAPSETVGKGVRPIQGDIRSEKDLIGALSEARPALIYHLSGIAFVPDAEKDKEKTLAVNLIGGLNLFEAVREKAPEAGVVVVSSSEVYGRVPVEKMPLTEEMPLRPANFYSFTKAALENAAFYAVASGLKVVVLRPFNHIGPGQSHLYVTSAFARQVAEAEAGLIPPVIKVGNLQAVRDFTDVEDMVRAYLLAGTKPIGPGPYNLCTGRGVRIQEILDILVDLARTEIRVEVDPERLRPSDMPVLIGDHSRFSRETGWSPQIPLKESLGRILDAWRSRCAP